MKFPTDVPVHRESVGAMPVASGSQMPINFKPYSYRGTGEDEVEHQELEQQELEQINANQRIKDVAAAKRRSQRKSQELALANVRQRYRDSQRYRPKPDPRVQPRVVSTWIPRRQTLSGWTLPSGEDLLLALVEIESGQ